jgi:hypothetical protein
MQEQFFFNESSVDNFDDYCDEQYELSTGDSFDNFDSFEEYDEAAENFAQKMHAQRAADAPARRAVGARLLAGATTFENTLERKSEVSGMPVEEVCRNLLRNNPEMIGKLKAYVFSRGRKPALDVDALCVQVAKLRHQQIQDVQRYYGEENYDADNFGFGSKARRAMRKKRRKAKWDRREKRRAMREEVREARLRKNLDEANQREAPEETAKEQEAPKEPYQRVAEETGEGKEVQELANPSEDEAHAEIVGAEAEMESYDGEADNFLPFLAGALKLGAKLISGGKVDKNEIKQLLSKPDTNKQKGSQADVLNTGIKEIVKTIETQKKKEFLKDNIVWILLGIVAVIGVGYFIGKKNG